MLGSYAAWYLGFSNYVVKSGDRISWRQYQTVAGGGIGISFTDGSNTNWTTKDTDGDEMNNDQTVGSWHYRTVDLTPFAGKTANKLWVASSTATPAGPWSILYGEIAIYSADGTVTTIYERQPGESFDYWTGGGETGTAAVAEESNTAADAETPDTTTTYYVGDQIGSARMQIAAGGWPVSIDDYYPFGVEQAAPADANHYKFTGKERDIETGNDYFGARYYSSIMGRFMSLDDVGGHFDNEAHNVLRLRYQHPFNTAVGAAVLMFLLVLYFAGSDDVIAVATGNSVVAIRTILRILVFLRPCGNCGCGLRTVFKSTTAPSSAASAQASDRCYFKRIAGAARALWRCRLEAVS